MEMIELNLARINASEAVNTFRVLNPSPSLDFIQS